MPQGGNSTGQDATIVAMRKHGWRRGAAALTWPAVLLGLLFIVLFTMRERSATAPSWLAAARQGASDVLTWVKESWLNAAAISAIAAIVAIFVPFIIRRLDQARSQVVSEPLTLKERQVLARRVHNKWINGVLEPSLRNAAQLALGLKQRPEALELGSRRLQISGLPPETLPADTSIGEAFDKAGGGLLILGAPGAGKTTSLLQLANELIKRAEKDPDQAIPIVVTLASWARDMKPLATWLVDELIVSYTVPQDTARALVNADRLIPLLDGLDEVAQAHRAACVEAINDYRLDHGLVPIVVCSRTQELEELGVRFRMEEAIELEPPSDAQISSYLGHLEASGTPIADIRQALERNQELSDLLRSPLMLHVVALAYHGRRASALEKSGSRAERQERLWEAYVERMFERRPLQPSHGYNAQQARAWLSWLAWRLRSRDETEFHVDRLGFDWLPTHQQQRDARLVFALVSGLIILVAVLPISWMLGRLLPGGHAAGVALGAVVALGYGWASWRGEVKWAEELHWSLRRAWVGGLSAVLIGGLAWIMLSRLFWRVGFSVIYDLAFAGFMLLIGGLLGGLKGQLRNELTLPNEGIQRSWRSALYFGLIGGIAGIILGLWQEPILGLALALNLGVLLGMAYGGDAYLHHLIVRRSLFRAGAAPLLYSLFLEAMTERLLLRRSGSSFLFTHRLLRDYLSDLHQRAPEAEAVQNR
jgi:hypothetical protein